MLQPDVLIAGRYALKRTLGQGGMGEVHEALDTSTGRRVALKRLHMHVPRDMHGLFEREYHTLASLRHPRIVEVYDYGSDASGSYYTMELLEGSDLSKLAPLPWREVCAFLRDAASILGVLHARRLVHRDLSPKNLWRTPDGRLKLIDFGSLSPFGPADVMGTPPFVPPEALAGAPLDQRYDLFSLGALGYWLLTGLHAFPAKSLGDLPRLHQREPSPPSQLMALGRSVSEELPPAELDRLLLALLKLNPSERPESTGELIDRLHQLVELPPESHDAATAGYLQSKTFVGRAEQCDRFNEYLRETKQSRGRALLIEGAPGIGRSRLLQELSLSARIAGVATLVAERAGNGRPYETVSDLALKLLAALPVQAERAAAPYVALLGSLSPKMRERLSAPALPPLAHEDMRARLQMALRDWFVSVSDRTPLALFVDDLHTIDPESQALLAALAHQAGNHKLLVSATLRRDGRELPAAINSYRTIASHFRLVPLSAADAKELLGSMFSGARYLERLSERVHRLVEGNPAYLLDVAEHLVRTSAIRYADGAWELPKELSITDLPRSREAGLAARLLRLPSAALAFARNLSVPHHGQWTRAACVAAGGLSPAESEPLLNTLIEHGVMEASGAAFSFAHEVMREQLYEGLTGPLRSAVHLRVGKHLAASSPDDSPFDQLNASLHLLRAGAEDALVPLRRAEAYYWATNAFSSLTVTAPLFVELLELRRRQGASGHELAGPLAILAISGYFADRTYAARYGGEALDVLGAVLHLPLARKASRFVSKKLALVIALLVTAISLRLFHRNAQLSVKQAVRMVIASAAALSGAAAVCLDVETGRRCTAALEPFAALGPDHIAGFLWRFTEMLSVQLHSPAAGEAKARALIERLESSKPVRELLPHSKASYLAGCYYALGVRYCWRDSAEALAVAERLESYGPLYAMSADHLRAAYHLGRGELQKGEHYRDRLELHAIQLGSAWQVETWSPVDLLGIAVRTYDALAAKRAAQELARLEGDVTALAVHERMARAAYLVMRGKHQQAIELLELPPLSPDAAVWALGSGILARAHNALGNHTRALEIAHDARLHLSPADLQSVAFYLLVQVEQALAEAGLGNFDTARAQLAELVAMHRPRENPLTMGELHLAQTKVELAAGALADAHAYLEQAAQRIKPTGIPQLIEQLELTRAQLSQATAPTVMPDSIRELSSDNDQLLDRVRHLLTRSGSDAKDRAHKGLQIALELTGADDGFVLTPGGRNVLAHSADAPPSAEIVAWAEQRLLTELVEDQTAMLTSVAEDNLKIVGRTRYCAQSMVARRDLEEVVVGLLVLGFHNRSPRLLAASVLYSLAAHLVDAESSTSLRRLEG